MPKQTEKQSLIEYLDRPSNERGLAVVREYQPEIDAIVHGMMGGSASPIVRRRAYIMAVQALKTYDPQRGVPFKKYLSVQLQPMRRMSRQIHEPITIPERHRRYQALLDKARMELLDELDREPSPQELADRTGLSLRQQKRIAEVGRNIMSVGGYQQATTTDENPAGLLPATDVYDEQQEWQDYVYHDLDDVDKQIYDARREGLVSNNELATKLNLTPGALSQRASRIEARMAKGPFA